MNKIPKFILLTLLIVFFLVTGLKFKQFVIDEEYIVFAHTACDQSQEFCFRLDCDPESDLDCDLSTYKKVEIVASEAPHCLFENDCEEFTCSLASNNCILLTCSEELLEEGEQCVSGSATGETSTEALWRPSL